MAEAELTKSDKLQAETCEAIVTTAALAVDAEPPGQATTMRLPEGGVVGKQITIDATEKGGLLNKCRITVLDPNVAPGSEVVRLEYEHDKQMKSGPQRVYSIQSMRRRVGELVLLENFLAETPQTVREADFRPISSEAYARTTVLATLQEWTHFRAYQLQELRKK